MATRLFFRSLISGTINTNNTYVIALEIEISAVSKSSCSGKGLLDEFIILKVEYART